LNVLEEYRAQKEEYHTKCGILQDVTEKRDEIQSRYDDLRQRRLDEFMAGFTQISQKLKEMYQVCSVMFGNGNIQKLTDVHAGWECRIGIGG
jgi:structural maintenance of chromosome 4